MYRERESPAIDPEYFGNITSAVVWFTVRHKTTVWNSVEAIFPEKLHFEKTRHACLGL